MAERTLTVLEFDTVLQTYSARSFFHFMSLREPNGDQFLLEATGLHEAFVKALL